MVMPGVRGMFVRYAKTDTVVIHCPHHIAETCRMTRTLRQSPLAHRSGQGRPLALMLAWAKHCPDGLTAKQHVHEFVPSLEQRQACRQELIELSAELPNLRELLERFERQPRDGEPLEPLHVP